MTPKEVIEFAEREGCKQLDVRFTDLPGLQQHISYPITELNEDKFEEGFGTADLIQAKALLEAAG